MTTELITKAVTEVAAAQKEHAAKIAAGMDALGLQQRELADRLVTLEQKGSSGPLEWSEPAPSLLRRFLASEQLRAVRNGAPSTGRVELKSTLPEVRKALLSFQGAQTTTNQYKVQAQREPGLYGSPLTAPIALLDVLPTLKATSNTFEYTQLHSSFTQAAAVQVYESDAKAEQSVPTTLASAPISTIAAWIRASLQVLSDAPQLEQQLSTLLTYGCMKKLEALIVAGAGGAGTISGLWTSGTALTTTGAQADRISSAIAQLQAGGWNPSLIVLHPTDWHEIRSERGTSNDGYVASGWNMPPTPSMWNLPVVQSAALTANNALVLDTSQVAVLDREAPQVQASRDDATNFTSNQVTLLAELRAGLAIFSPAAVGKVTLA